MSTATAPTIPPRPARAQQAAAARGVDKLPEIPPRPFPKRLDRSVSPGNYPRSPLNEPWQPLSKSKSNEPTAALKRPSVQHLPSVGQEGDEYADIDAPPARDFPTEQTRSIGHDLHLHAPKPSLPISAATAQVQAVTRTDSSQAAAHGFGKPSTPGHEDGDHLGRVRSRASFSRPGSSASGHRRMSVQPDEQGPAEIGIRVPINPLLGDVQAPSPAPFTPSHTGEKRRSHHSRTKSRDGLPPGSYGLHGHGVAPTDPFERDWYAKHPDELQHEEAHGHGVYEGIGSGRGAFALSSDDLNKIVRDTASRGAGFGTTGNIQSYPDEQIAYIANENRVHQGGNALTKSLTNVSQPAVESPLRKSSVPQADMDPVVSFSRRAASGKSDSAIDSPLQTPVHIDSPEQRFSKISGGEETINETTELGPSISRPETGYDSDHSAPILASDEVAKHHTGEWLHPAVSPRVDRRTSDFEYRSGDATPTSRPSSRPGSIHGMHSSSYSLARFTSHHDERDSMHTPLEDVDEYEPLFPDDDKKAMSHAERFKQRPDALKHRFPSKDIWEDAPDYGMYQATVSTPDLQLEPEQQPASISTFETPEQEAAGKGEHSETHRRRQLAQRTNLPSHLQDEIPTRPGLQPRFPSQDIWEDSPDSQHLVTTVSSPPILDDTSPVEPSRPSIPPRPLQKSRLADGPSAAQPAPIVPARPARKTETSDGSPTELKKVPSIPDRPKPQVPPRPAKKLSGDTLSKVISAASDQGTETERTLEATSPPLPKVKPQVPARPGPSAKFAGLKGNFMNDLNQKLGLGPPKEKEAEPQPEEEAKPLEDARKGRARGPQRRAPAKSPSGDASIAAPARTRFSISKPQSLWHIDDSGLLNVGSSEADPAAQDEKTSKVDTSVPIDTGKSELLGNATVADTPLPPTIDTTAETTTAGKADDTPDDIAPQAAPTNGHSEVTDSTPNMPVSDQSQPLSHQASNEAAFLTHQSTESSNVASGPDMERVDTYSGSDIIPASQQTTASIPDQDSSNLNGAPLERKATEVPVQLRNEQVSAPVPSGVSSSTSTSFITEPSSDTKSAVNQSVHNPASNGSQGDTEPIVTKEQAQKAQAQDIVEGGADKAAEPMPERDVSYTDLEAMQSQADGKELSDGGIRKIVE